MSAKHRLSRREFVAAGIAATAASGAFAQDAPTQEAKASAEQPAKLRVAFIAVGGRGGANLQAVSSDPRVEVVALCDVNKQNLDRAAMQHPDARTFRDFRKLYAELSDDDFDAVVVSTPEHTHAFATMPALRRGKHVYCEKPLTHNVYEARAITEAAAQAGVATQMGTQIHSQPNYRRVVELIQTGAIGDVTEAHVWVGRAWGLQSPEEAMAHGDIISVLERPTEECTTPEFLDWNLWVGPAPMRPYHDVYFPGPKWYRWWDFGNGTMSDLGSHWVDLPFWALNLDAPTSIEPLNASPHPEIAPASMTAVYEYPARGERPALRLTWYQGVDKPEIWKDGGIPQWGSGVLFIGTEGMLLSDYGKYMLLPEEKFRDFKPPEKFIPDSPGQQAEWVEACLTGSETGSPFSYAGPLTEANHLGNVAYRAGQKIEWDAANMRIPNLPSAEKFLGREPRDGWSLDE